MQVLPRQGGASFGVLLTSYELVLGKEDVARLGSLRWEYLVVDEAHRLKNAGSRLRAQLKQLRFRHILLLTGVLELGQFLGAACSLA